MLMSETIDKLAAALVAAQGAIGEAKREASNPAFGGKKYADLGSVWDAAKPALQAHGLSVVQTFEPSEVGTLALCTTLLHSSGQWISGTCFMPLQKHDPQGYGSAATYARRYGLMALLGICPEDDDGNAASGQGNRQQTTQPARPAQQPQKPTEKTYDRDAEWNALCKMEGFSIDPADFPGVTKFLSTLLGEVVDLTRMEGKDFHRCRVALHNKTKAGAA